eukprot:COSAG06_NODE_3182_length_5719_cov_58.908363_5_plen_238_part_00
MRGETVAADHLHARCWPRKRQGSRILSVADYSYRSGVRPGRVVCAVVRSCVHLSIIERLPLFRAQFLNTKRLRNGQQRGLSTASGALCALPLGQAYCESLPWAEAYNCALEHETLAEAQNLVDRQSPSNCQKEIPCWTVHEKTSPVCGSPSFTSSPLCTGVHPTIEFSEPDKVSRAQDWVAAGCKRCTHPEEEANCEQQQLLDALGEDCSGSSPLLHIFIGAAIGVGIAIGENCNLI